MEKTETREFSFKWSKLVIILTGFALLIILSMIFLLMSESFWTSVGLIFMVVVFGYYTLISPLKLIVDRNEILIKRIFGKVSILIPEVLEIKILTELEVIHSIRKWGSGGYFGYIGWFYNKSLGNHYMYATNMDNLIFIRTAKKNYVVSCEQPQEFIKTVNSFSGIS